MKCKVSMITAVLLGVTAIATPERASAQTRPASVGPDVPPDVPASVYRARRDRLASKLGSCVGVLASKPPASGIDEYFYYLTGIEERSARLMLAPRAPLYKQTLTLPSRDPESEIWVGYREPMSFGLRAKYGVDMVTRTRGAAPPRFGNFLGLSRCFATLRFGGSKADIDPKALAKYLTSYGARTEQKWQALEQLRAVHDAAEIKLMDKAIAITIEGHRAAARSLRVGLRERTLASTIDDAFYQHGATGLAFPSIVGAGPNGAILHWEKRNRIIEPGDLVVVDIGSSYGHYASDVTRTYPVSGKFEGEQRKVYETVLAIQNKVIAAVRPGISLDRLDAMATEGIVAAGYQPSHFVGHFVGINVHDVGDRTKPLEPGMVITVEPGIYLKNKFGVRIEDMVLVTPRGGRLMTAALPRSVADVEKFMAAARGAK